MSPVDTIQGASGNGLPIPRLDPGEPATDQIFSAPRLILASLSGLACLAALQALALPRWPEAASLAEPAVLASLRGAGLEVRALPSIPGQRSSELARGPRLSFQLRDGATTASLQLLPAQVRQRANFQLALISRGQPSLALPPGLPLRSDGSVAYVEGHLGNHQLRQTCLVSLPPGVTSGPSSNGATRSAAQAMAASTPIPVGGVSAAQLGAAADRGASGGLVTISRIVGLSPNRNFGCLLVSLGMENGSKAEGAAAAGMERLWKKILPVLSTF